MRKIFNIDCIKKIEYIPYHESLRFKWFDNPKGLIFTKPSGVYYIDEYGQPKTQWGMISNDYVEIKRKLEIDEKYIVVNPEKMQIYVKSAVKIWFINDETPEVIYFQNNSEAEEFYDSIVAKIPNTQGI